MKVLLAVLTLEVLVEVMLRRQLPAVLPAEVRAATTVKKVAVVAVAELDISAVAAVVKIVPAPTALEELVEAAVQVMWQATLLY
jgi:hypothetical protein